MGVKRYTAWLVAVVLGTAGGGCSVSQTDDPIRLAVSTAIAIDVVSFNGDVIIRTDERLEEATLRFRREATHGAGRTDEAKASLPLIEYSYELVPGEFGPLLRIRTWTTHAEPYFQRAHVQITAPAVDGVSILTQRGKIFATDIAGPVNIETTEGDVKIKTNLAMLSDVTIVNEGGDIEYRIRGESSGAFNCHAERGRVHIRVLYGRLVVSSQTADTVLATLNDGQNAIDLRTTDGNIEVHVEEDPTQHY